MVAYTKNPLNYVIARCFDIYVKTTKQSLFLLKGYNRLCPLFYYGWRLLRRKAPRNECLKLIQIPAKINSPD